VMKFSCRFVTTIDYICHIRCQYKRCPIPKHTETNYDTDKMTKNTIPQGTLNYCSTLVLYIQWLSYLTHYSQTHGKLERLYLVKHTTNKWFNVSVTSVS
jgi:hypothetical protein